MRFSRPLVFPLITLLSCAAGNEGQMKGGNPLPESALLEPSPVLPSLVDVAPRAPSFALGLGKVIEGPKDVPLAGKQIRAEAGDIMLTSEGRVAVISQAGQLIDFGDEKGKDGIIGIGPTVQIGLSIAGTEVQDVRLVGDKHNIVRVLSRVWGEPMGLAAFYSFGEAGVLFMESVAFSVPEEEKPEPPSARRLPALMVTLGELVEWGNLATWVEGVGSVDGGGISARADFIARGGAFGSYALCSEEGRLFVQISPSSSYGYLNAASTGERVVPVVVGGTSERRRVAIAVSQSSLADAAMALPCVRSMGVRRVSLPTIPLRGVKALVSRCGEGGASRVFAEVELDSLKFGKKNRELDLPAGCLDARLAAPGHAPGPWARVEALSSEPLERFLPASGKLRVVVTANGKQLPARLMVRGQYPTSDPNWGEEPFSGASLNVAYLDRGEAELPLPPGKYAVAIGRGFEYSVYEQAIEVVQGKEIAIAAKIERVVDTKGFVSADLHVHAEPSFDAPVPLDERVRSLVAAGVEVAVATDHNALTDYGPTIREMGLSGEVASVVGDEVTVDEPPIGHFNVFPLLPNAKPLDAKGVLPAEVFGQARRQEPYRQSTLIQVNHPRWGAIGYFDLLRLDTDNIKASLERAPLADMGFDLLEVYNGSAAYHLPSVEAVLRDQFALLNAGFRVVATGNSDSHRMTYHEAGLPRNMVFVDSDAPGSFSEARFVDALRQGRVTVSGGPYVLLSVDGKGIGEEVSPGEREVVIRADGPSWVDISRVELWNRGKLVRSYPVSGRKGVFEVKSRETLAKGDWVVAIARGDKSMDVYVPGVKPFGFTNPVFVR